MKAFYTKISLGLALTILLFNCSGGSDSPSPTPPEEVDPPEAATLIFPDENAECTEGSNFTATQSDVVFDWTDATNADSYELVIKNLNTQSSTTHTSSSSQVSVTILRGTPYSWYVISKNEGSETATSSTWKFYNAGEPTSWYAPFPAELVSPAMGTSLNNVTNVQLQWTGSDVDNDIENYDVYFDTVSPPVVAQANTTATNATVTVSSGNTYYWRVVTNDEQGNTSTSEIFQFKVD